MMESLWDSPLMGWPWFARIFHSGLESDAVNLDISKRKKFNFGGFSLDIS
jgi:hypothetical protein